TSSCSLEFSHSSSIAILCMQPQRWRQTASRDRRLQPHFPCLACKCTTSWGTNGRVHFSHSWPWRWRPF
ncbi:hypothetical protein LTR39_005834, partial [Cryomyces antarcticus]